MGTPTPTFPFLKDNRPVVAVKQTRRTKVKRLPPEGPVANHPLDPLYSKTMRRIPRTARTGAHHHVRTNHHRAPIPQTPTLPLLLQIEDHHPLGVQKGFLPHPKGVHLWVDHRWAVLAGDPPTCHHNASVPALRVPRLKSSVLRKSMHKEFNPDQDTNHRRIHHRR